MAALAALSAAFLAHAAVRARVVRSPALHAARRCTTLAASESCKGDSGLVIIDSHNMAYRMYFAMPPLISKTGEPAHATLGFCNRLAKLRDEFPGYRLLAVFDEGAPTRRLSMLPEYKEVCHRTARCATVPPCDRASIRAAHRRGSRCQPTCACKWGTSERRRSASACRLSRSTRRRRTT